MKLNDIFESLKSDLDELDVKREYLLPITRDIVRICSEIIKSVHRNELDDIEDQMMRFNTTRVPGNTTRIPERGGDQNPVNYTLVNPIDKYAANPIINILYGWLLEMINKSIYEYAKMTDQYHSEDFFWQRTPWEVRNEHDSDRLRQDSGLSYLLPYYIGRYLNVFPETD